MTQHIPVASEGFKAGFNSPVSSLPIFPNYKNISLLLRLRMRSLYFLFFLSFLYHQRVHSVIFNCSNDTSFELMKDSSLDTEFTTTFQFNYFTTAPGFSIEIRLSKSASFDGSTVKGIDYSLFPLSSCLL